MPIGVIIDALSVLIGGILGTVLKEHINERISDQLNMILGLASLGMGITAIILVKNMPAVILALVIGTLIGILLHMEESVRNAAVFVQKKIGTSDENADLFVTAIVLFCASGTGIYGSLIAGMNGDQSVLIAKSILDLFTAMIFACTLSKSVCLIAIPQFAILFVLFLLAGVILPLTNEVMINDFKACGGFIMLATGFRMLKLKQFPVAAMIPSMILVMPLSWIWSSLVIPWIG